MKTTALSLLFAVAILQSGCMSHYVAKHAIRKARAARAEAKIAKADARATRADARSDAEAAVEAGPYRAQ